MTVANNQEVCDQLVTCKTDKLQYKVSKRPRPPDSDLVFLANPHEVNLLGVQEICDVLME